MLTAPAQVEELRGGPKKSYVLLKERDLRKLPALPPQWIIAGRSSERTTWYLVASKSAIKLTSEILLRSRSAVIL